MEATLRVALPAWFLAARQDSWAKTPDVTGLVEEWALALLDPVEAMRRVAPAALKLPGWDLCGKATVTATTMRLVRDAAADREIEAAIADAVGPGRMTLQGACLLLGLAAVTALDANIGKEAATALADVKKRADRQEAIARAATQRERQRSAPVAAEAEAARPTLTPIAPDAWGDAVK